MHKKSLVLTTLLSVLIITLMIGLFTGKEEDNKFKIVTSFYPTYIMTLNLVKDIPNIEVTNIVTSTTGCIHDYTLNPSDMKKVEEANLMIINGAGMEGFINDITSSYPNLKIINASNNISLLGNNEEINSHVWMDPTKYIEQIKNVSKSLSTNDPNNKDQYKKNAEEYIAKINTLMMSMQEKLEGIKNKKVIIFHDAFEYLANYLGLDVVYTVDMDHDEALSASEVKDIIEIIKENNINILLVEKQFTNSVIETIKKEVDVNVYSLDTIVTGNYTINAYLEAMNYNINLLKEVLS